MGIIRFIAGGFFGAALVFGILLVYSAICRHLEAVKVRKRLFQLCAVRNTHEALSRQSMAERSHVA